MTALPPLTQGKAHKPKLVRAVDLFCGCGGLSLGFDLFRGNVVYQTVLGVDNDAAALRIYNNNRSREDGTKLTGRNADLTWFSHRSEVLLFYLDHFARWADDSVLHQELEALGYRRFLGEIHQIDRDFQFFLDGLCQSKDFSTAFAQVEKSVSNIALVKSCFSKLGFSFGRRFYIDSERLPWGAECYDAAPTIAKMRRQKDLSIERSLTELWETQLGRLRNAASSTGRGQHSVVAGKVQSLNAFFRGVIGTRLKQAWTSWRTARDSTRAFFCLSNFDRLQELYDEERSVGLLLGGPPCKGWSRIGRAVIESLREQGVHAWASHDYGDERNALLHNYVLFLEALKPDVFVFENVAHFGSSLRTPSGSINAAKELQTALNLLEDKQDGYEVQSQILSAKKHAVPQDRNRYFMIGLRKKGALLDSLRVFEAIPRFNTEVPLRVALSGLEDPGVFGQGDPKSSRDKHLTRISVVADGNIPAAERAFLEWIRRPNPKSNEAPVATDSHIVRRPRADDEQLFRFLAPGLRWMDYKFSRSPTILTLRCVISSVERFQSHRNEPHMPSASSLRTLLAKLDGSLLLRLLLEASATETKEEEHHLLQAGYLAKGDDRHGDWLERLSPDRPCKTIVAHIGKDTYGYIHPTQPRAISIREAARIQSFPDFFSFQTAGIVDAYSMIGNAVPPLLAYQLAAAIAAVDEATPLFRDHATQNPQVSSLP